ncbi:MAG: M23 family metallopeptidase [bacterium]|nr:M23 family metallopeptidase [bacterium]
MNRRMQKAAVVYAGLAAVNLLLLGGCAAGGGGGGGGNGGAGSEGEGEGEGSNPNGLTADAGTAEQTATVESGHVATVKLDASASASPNSTITSYQWSDRDCGELATGATAEVPLGIGAHTITLTVGDSAGGTDQTQIVISVADERPSEFSLAIVTDGEGRTDPPPDATTMSTRDATVTVTALPDPGWRFARWTGHSEVTTATTTVVMNADKSLTAVFEEIPTDDGVPRLFLPWPAGETKTIGQANNGTFSHEGRFAWDLQAEIGTPVLAAAAGRVVKVVDNLPNNAEGVTGDPDDPANTVQIDHGNGLQSIYAHLDPFGAAVVAGQMVYRGQYLARSGNSGYGTGPHLHYEVLDPANRSASSGFAESAQDGGIAEEGDRLTSANELDLSSLDDFEPSTLPVDAFAENGIELIEPTPPAFVYTANATYTVRGRVTGVADNVCVALVDPDSGDTAFCELKLVAPDRTFEFDFTFGPELAGEYLMGVVSGVAGASGLAPVNVTVSPPAAENGQPQVVVTDPDDSSIDFGGTGTLSGAGTDPDGDALTYAWAQVSGPPAAIADPTAAETTFTLPVGDGPTCVAFQLTAHDGIDSSAPAEVVFQMPDNFHVIDLGVTDTNCGTLADCQAAGDGDLDASARRVTIWVELLNLNAGDTARFEIRSPSGAVELSGPFCDPIETSVTSSFWRFSWSTTGTSSPLEPGEWRAVYLRNEIVEASLDFTVVP